MARIVGFYTVFNALRRAQIAINPGASPPSRLDATHARWCRVIEGLGRVGLTLRGEGSVTASQIEEACRAAGIVVERVPDGLFVPRMQEHGAVAQSEEHRLVTPKVAGS